MKELRIQHMVCPRCIEAVEDGLRTHDMEWESVELGRVKLSQAPDEEQLQAFSDYISGKGFELVSDTGNQLAMNVQNQLLTYLEQLEAGNTMPLKSAYLEKTLYKNYSYMSEQFSTSQGITIEQYWIRLKCERAKELLENHELSITDIAYRLGYNSSQYFANQFKSITGISPGQWRKSGSSRSGRAGLAEG